MVKGFGSQGVTFLSLYEQRDMHYYKKKDIKYGMSHRAMALQLI